MDKNDKELKRTVNTLVKRISDKDEFALTELYNCTYKLIFSFLRRYTNDKEVIKDTISMTFLTIIEKSKAKLFYINCFSWILTISKYHLFNNIRSNNKCDYIDESDIKEFTSDCSGLSFDVKLAIDKMSEFDRKILYLKFHEDLTIEKMSKILKVSVSTIKRELKVIYSELKEELKNE